jgi:hypothetical protein
LRRARFEGVELEKDGKEKLFLKRIIIQRTFLKMGVLSSRFLEIPVA